MKTKIYHEDGYKYPYIPKKYLAAVFFACSIIRQRGLQKASQIAANYYDVDLDSVLLHVKARVEAGKQWTKKTAQTKKAQGIATFKYYLVAFSVYHFDGDDRPDTKYVVTRRKNEQRALEAIASAVYDFNRENHYEGSFGLSAQAKIVSDFDEMKDAFAERLAQCKSDPNACFDPHWAASYFFKGIGMADPCDKRIDKTLF